MIFFQLILLAWVFMIRGPRLFGRHLKPLADVKDGLRRDLYLYFFDRSKIRERYALHLGIHSKKRLIPFVVRKERWYHRWLKSLGLAHEVAIPDPNFDQQYYITTDFPHHLEALLADGVLLKELQALFERKVKTIYVGFDRVWCSLDDADFTQPPTYYEPFFTSMRKLTILVVKDLNLLYRHSRTWLVSAFLASHLAILIIGISGIFAVIGEENIINKSSITLLGLGFGLAAMLIWQGLIVLCFRHTSWLGWVLADFWIWGLAGMLIAGVTLTQQANLTLPQALPTLHRQNVLNKECVVKCYLDCGRRCSRTENFRYGGEAACNPEYRKKLSAFHLNRSEICRYQLRFDYEIKTNSWQHHPSENIAYRTRVYERVFDAVKIGGTVTIPVHQGALGFEWVDYRKIYP